MAPDRVRGSLVGPTPSLLDLVNGDLKTAHDSRQVHATILDEWLGVASRTVLGGTFERLPLFRVGNQLSMSPR